MLENRHFTTGDAKCGPVSGFGWGRRRGGEDGGVRKRRTEGGRGREREEEEQRTAFYKAMVTF